MEVFSFYFILLPHLFEDLFVSYFSFLISLSQICLILFSFDFKCTFKTPLSIFTFISSLQQTQKNNSPEKFSFLDAHDALHTQELNHNLNQKQNGNKQIWFHASDGCRLIKDFEKSFFSSY